MVELYVNDIENALKNKSYFSALAMSLALPDICGAAEYPNETSTAKRYIEWYNKYLGEYMSDDSGNPYLSGEIVYNLRNTFLHAGSPNIDSNKIKDEANQLDRFMLFLGDGTEMCVTLFINTSIVKLRSMIVDVTYLCKQYVTVHFGTIRTIRINFISIFRLIRRIIFIPVRASYLQEIQSSKHLIKS